MCMEMIQDPGAGLLATLPCAGRAPRAANVRAANVERIGGGMAWHAWGAVDRDDNKLLVRPVPSRPVPASLPKLKSAGRAGAPSRGGVE